MAQREEKKVVNLIRILATDINADANIVYGLAKISGVSVMFANATCVVLGLDKTSKISELSEKDTERIEEFLNNPVKEGIPSWMLNSQKDVILGTNLHYAGKDLDFANIQLKRRLSKTKSYRALRHKARLPVRGQRTKSNFRRSKTLAAMKAKKGGHK